VLRYVHLTAPADVDAREIQRILLDIAGPEAQEDAVNSAEQLRHEGELKGRAEGELKGRAEGELKGLRAAITTALSARQVTLGEPGRIRLSSCADATTLTRWLTHAVVATSDADVFGDEDSL
jgi:predicted transposase YdaD